MYWAFCFASVFLLLSGCAPVERQQSRVRAWWATVSGTASHVGRDRRGEREAQGTGTLIEKGEMAIEGARETVSGTVEAGRAAVQSAQKAVEDLQERAAKIEEGAKKIQEGKQLIQEGVK
ncbi:MAG: hypothetical protein PHN33_05580 [Candidatus Peribacteraceae bacterium]|nr:hypothetical protein [Candidatus Peribacteraceae bacterium]